MDGTEATTVRKATSAREKYVEAAAIPGAGGTVHLVGGLGAGLRAAAEVLLGCAATRITASDRSLPDGLLPSGFRLFEGHRAENVPGDATLLIRSDAIDDENVELRRARSLGIPVLSYFDWLGRISAGRPTTAVAGTHGKSTTTALLGWIMESAGLDPLVVCGAAPPQQFSGGRSGAGELIVEACEYRRNFLKLKPSTAAILGIEDDHFDCFPTRDLLETAFERFAALVPETGRLLVRHSCATSRRIARSVSRRVETFGLFRAADWSARLDAACEGCFEITIQRHGRPFCTARLQVPGRHHVLAATAAAALAHYRGATAEAITRGLTTFTGIERRLQRREPYHGIEMIDDYAHHPTALAVAIDTVRSMYPTRRLWCMFQPHRRLRTERLMEKLAESLARADAAIVTDIYLAREENDRESTVERTSQLADRLALLVGRRLSDFSPCGDDLSRRGNVFRCTGREQAERLIRRHLRPGDVLLLLGAGDIYRFFR